jgi:hypothetical protein
MPIRPYPHVPATPPPQESYLPVYPESYKEADRDVFAPYDTAVMNAAIYLFPDAYIGFSTGRKYIAYLMSKINTLDYDNKLIKFPIVAVQRATLDYDNTRFGQGLGKYPHRNRKLKQDNTLVEMWRRMTPARISYQFDIVENRLTSQMNSMVFRLMAELDNANYTYLNVDFGDPYGTLSIFWQFDGIVDNSDLEPADPGKDRIVRYTVATLIEAWLPRGFGESKTVKHFELDENLM